LTVTSQAASATSSPSFLLCPGNSTGAQAADVGVVATPVSTTATESLTALGVAGVAYMTTNGSGSASAPGGFGEAHFNYTNEFMPPTGSGAPKRVANSTLNLNGAAFVSTSNSVISPAAPLAGLTLPQLSSAADSALTAQVLAPLETTIIPTINGTLGLSLGGADIGALNMNCRSLALVK